MVGMGNIQRRWLLPPHSPATAAASASDAQPLLDDAVGEFDGVDATTTTKTTESADEFDTERRCSRRLRRRRRKGWRRQH